MRVSYPGTPWELFGRSNSRLSNPHFPCELHALLSHFSTIASAARVSMSWLAGVPAGLMAGPR